MALTVTHPFVSAIADGVDNTLVQPSDWNANHTISGALLTATALKTTNYTAVVNDLVLCNTSGGAFTVTLPATPSTGDTVGIYDVNGTFVTYNLTVGRNGSTIQGIAADLILNINSTYLELQYLSSSWRMLTIPQGGLSYADYLSLATGGII